MTDQDDKSISTDDDLINPTATIAFAYLLM